MENFKCPKCGSEHTQSIQMALQVGTQRGQSKTSISGVGVGLGGGVGVGVATADTASFSQTDLARKYQLPPYPNYSTALILMAVVSFIFSFIFLISSLYRLSFSSILFGGFFLFIIKIQSPAIKKSQKEWSDRKNYLNKAWLCHRCGSNWIPQI